MGKKEAVGNIGKERKVEKIKEKKGKEREV